VKRRDFLQASAGLTGILVPTLGWSLSRPCPPARFGVRGGNALAADCSSDSGELPWFMLTSRAAAGNHGWTIGQPFAKGDIPAGQAVALDEAQSQCEIRSYWHNDDGSRHSVKLAVLSGISAFSAGGSRRIQVRASGPVTTSTFVTEGDLRRILGQGDISVAFQGGMSGSASLSRLIGLSAAPAQGLGGTVSPGLVRTLPGTVMSEFHYLSPVDRNLHVWFYCRAYQNGQLEIETVVENGWVNVTTPENKTYSFTVSVNGRSVATSGSIAHYHHTRWSRVDWFGVDPQITPQHDVAYLRRTRLVPNWTFGSPTAEAIGALAFTDGASPAPFAPGNWPAGANKISSGGDTAMFIGLGLRAVAMYCASGRPEAYHSMLGMERAHGRYPIYYRDETTLRPLRPSAYPAYGLAQGGGGAGAGWYYGSGNTPDGLYFPSPSGSIPVDQTYDNEHHPAAGYYGYLVTGRWPFMEQCQAQASVVVRALAYADREMAAGTTAWTRYGVRANAWTLRSVAQAAVVSDDPFRTDFEGIVARTASFHLRQVPDNALGLTCSSGEDASQVQNPPGNDGTYWYAPFQVDYWTQVLGFISELGVGGPDLITIRNRQYKHVVGRFGDPATGFDYRRAGAFRFPYGTESRIFIGARLRSSWREVYEYLVAARQWAPLPNDRVLRTDNNSNAEAAYGPNEMATSYHAFALPGLSYAVDHGAPGAAEALQRLMGSTTWTQGSQMFNHYPTHGVMPRSMN